MKKSFRKKKYSKNKYKTNKRKNKIKKRGKYTKRRKYTKKTLRLIGGSSTITSPTSDRARCLSLLDTENNWIPITLEIKEITNHSEGDFVKVVITNLNNNKTVTIESNEYLIRDKKQEVHDTDFRYLHQITIVLNAEQSVAQQYLHKTSVKGYQSKLILGFPASAGCAPKNEYTKLMESGLLAEGTRIAVAAEEEAARIAAASHPTLDVAATAIDFVSVVNLYGEFKSEYKECVPPLVNNFPCLVFNRHNEAWENINLEYLVSPDTNNTFIKMGNWILGSSTINIVEPKNNRSDSKHVNPNFQLRLNLNPQVLNLNPQVYGDRSTSGCPYLDSSSDTQYSHKLILGWEEKTHFINFIQSTGGNLQEFENIGSEPESEPVVNEDEVVEEDFEFVNTEDVDVFETIPIYKNTMVGTHAKTNLVIVSDRKDGTLKHVYFIKDGVPTHEISGSSPQNRSLEGWRVELIQKDDVGVRGGITGVDNPHGLIKLTAPDAQHAALSLGKLYLGSDGGNYLNPIKILPRVGGNVGSLTETLSLYHKLKDFNEIPILDLYIQAVTHVISKFEGVGGIETGGVFRVQSDYLSEHRGSFDEYLSGLNRDNIHEFMRYVDELPKDPKLLADLLKKMYREIPIDIISESCLELITPGNTDEFYKSLGGRGSKRSILLKLLLSLLKEIHESEYDGDEKMGSSEFAPLLPAYLKIDELFNAAARQGDSGSLNEIFDKIEILILHV